MKRIGILYDKTSKKVFLLPNDVKTLTSKGINVSIASGAGMCVGATDNDYAAAGAKVCNQWQDVIANSDILLKVNAFNKKEIKTIGKKIAITMASYLCNVDMLFNMLQNNTLGLEWNGLTNKSEFVFFPKIEELKAPVVLQQLQQAFKTGLTKKEKDKVKYPDNPNLLILNATYAGVTLAKQALQAGFNVTISDNDSKYLSELKDGLKKLKTCDAKYETLVKQVREAHAFVVTTVSPLDVAKNRVTKDMAETMPKGSLLIDAGCEYGYSFQFLKKWADKELKWRPQGKSFYMAYVDMSDLFGKEASKIISCESVNYLVKLAQDGTQSFQKIIACEDGKVINSNIHNQLRLY